MPRKSSKKAKARNRKQVEDVGEREKDSTPRCFVIKRGPVGALVKVLMEDFKEVMTPNCASKLRATSKNRIEDFVSVAGPLNVSHLVMFSASKNHTWMKLAKLPAGPTLTFQVDSFSIAKDVQNSVRRLYPTLPADLVASPLQVLNGFSKAAEGAAGAAGMQKLTSEMLRGMFPPVDVQNFRHSELRRAALFNYEPNEDVIHFRHYTVGRKVLGFQKGVNKLLRPNRLPKLGHVGDVADFILSGGVGFSESEAEDAMEIPNFKGTPGKTAIRLCERGPRMTLKLVKAEEGLCSGEVLYHRYKHKLPTQQELLEARAKQKRALKERNAAIEKQVEESQRARKRRKMDRKSGQDEQREEVEEGPFVDQGFIGAGKPPVNPKKKSKSASSSKRFHPLAWGKNSKRKKKSEAADDGS